MRVAATVKEHSVEALHQPNLRGPRQSYRGYVQVQGQPNEVFRYGLFQCGSFPVGFSSCTLSLSLIALSEHVPFFLRSLSGAVVYVQDRDRCSVRQAWTMRQPSRL